MTGWLQISTHVTATGGDERKDLASERVAAGALFSAFVTMRGAVIGPQHASQQVRLSRLLDVEQKCQSRQHV